MILQSFYIRSQALPQPGWGRHHSWEYTAFCQLLVSMTARTTMSQPRSSFALWSLRTAIPGLVKEGKLSAADLQENSRRAQCLEVKGCKRELLCECEGSGMGQGSGRHASRGWRGPSKIHFHLRMRGGCKLIWKSDLENVIKLKWNHADLKSGKK